MWIASVITSLCAIAGPSALDHACAPTARAARAAFAHGRIRATRTCSDHKDFTILFRLRGPYFREIFAKYETKWALIFRFVSFRFVSFRFHLNGQHRISFHFVFLGPPYLSITI